MLSELYHLSKNVAKAQGQIASKHPDCDEPGLSGYTNIKLLIGDGGILEHLELLSPTDTKGENRLRLWTLTHIFRKKRNRVYFPAIRIDKPLISLEDSGKIWEDLKKSPKEGLLQLLSGAKNVEPIRLKDERDQAQRISQWRHDENEDIAILNEFAKSFLQITADETSFSIIMLDFLQDTLRKRGDDKLAKAIQALVCGFLNESKGKRRKIECKVQIVLDYRPHKELSGVLYSPGIERIVIDCLKNDTKKDFRQNQESSFTCALAGRKDDSGPQLKASFTKWPAKPVIGMPFYAFSKNTYTSSGAPCNARYRKGDADSFPIGRETANRLVEFAASMTTQDMQGITWKGIWNGKIEGEGKKKKESQDVLIAYPSFKWDDLAPVSVFSRVPHKQDSSIDPDELGYEENDSINEGIPKGFKQVAESYIRAIEEKIPETERNKNFVKLLFLRAITSGQVQLVYSASPNCEEFDAALDFWTKSESYLPERLLIPLPSKRAENGLGWYRPRLLFPDEAVRIFTHQWKRVGTDSHRIQAPPVSDLLNVFLRIEGVWKQSAIELLNALIPRVEPLLIAAGQRIHLTDNSNLSEWNEFAPMTAQGTLDKTKPDPRYFLTQALSLTGTLLHALNPQASQHYMKETAYQLGRLLAAMDQLHKCYCDGERDGSYPPTLIGNGLLGRAADSPQEALAELCERGRIYVGWAKTGKPIPMPEGLAENKAKSIKRQRNAVYRARDLFEFIDPLCREIHASADLANPMSTQDKAHLFLGYLTEVPRKKWDETPSSPTDPTIKEQQNQSE